MIESDCSGLLAKAQLLQANLQPALKAAGLVMLAQAQQAIKDSGPGWQPFKHPPKPTHQLLWATGTLLQSLSIGGAGNVLEVDDTSITVGTNVAYAAYQNFGTKSLPARKFLQVTERNEQLASSAFIKRLLQGIST